MGTYYKQIDRELSDATLRKKIWHVHTLAEELHHRPIREITAAEVLAVKAPDVVVLSVSVMT